MYAPSMWQNLKELQAEISENNIILERLSVINRYHKHKISKSIVEQNRTINSPYLINM
jgi:hypothetical protein